MSDRFCLRGCTRRGEHWAVCPDYGREDGTCRGCVQVEARDGALVCERCYRSLRRHLEDAADLVGHLRSLADPTKAAPIARGAGGSRVEAPAPVAADLIDASDDIVRTLRAWALYVQFGEGHPWRVEGLEAGIDGADAYTDAAGCAEVILDALDGIANDSHQSLALCEGVMVVHPGDPDVWSIADAAARWPLDEEPRWAPVPCPACDLLTVRVEPHRGRRPTRYRCASDGCGWEANALDDGGLWSAVFADPVQILADDDHPRHDPDLLTLSAAARVAGRTVGTIRTWVSSGDLARHLGRVRRDDVIAVKARKEGVRV
ncbi:hypothetical protein [Microbacterium sp. S308A+]